MVVPHLYGAPADIVRLEHIAKAHGVALIDDAAQSFGARVDGRMLGALGDVGVISFGPGKPLTATGGGLLLTDREDIAERVKAARIQPERYAHKLRQTLSFVALRRFRCYTSLVEQLISRFSRESAEASASTDDYPIRSLSNVDAALVESMLERLHASICVRKERATYIAKRLEGNGLLKPYDIPAGSICTKVVALMTSGWPSAPADYQTALWDCGVETSSVYAPLHEDRDFAPSDDCPLPWTDRLARRLVIVPSEPSMSAADLDYVLDCCRQFVARAAASDHSSKVVASQ
jgi:dTDP-4-amino-4,6-dideoxygalactose transaminase